MSFVYSLKLFGSNWGKTLKLFLYYIVIWGICTALLLPAIFAFKDIVIAGFKTMDVVQSFSGVFKGGVGIGIHNFAETSYKVIVDIFNNNMALAIYALVVIFIVLPFLINIGKYTFSSMLYSYMTSKAKVGFFSALIKNLTHSLVFAICRTLYNLVFFVLILVCFYAMSLVQDMFFITYLFPWVVFLMLALLFTLHQMTVLGWAVAMIVFDCNVFSAYRKSIKAVGRHFWATFGTTLLSFLCFWALIMIFGVFTMVVLVPLMTIFLCVYENVVFFTSQGMRFYFTDTQILTPKKLEEVDNINKTAYIL